MSPGNQASCRPVDTAGLPPGPHLAGARPDGRAAAVPAPVPPLPAQEVRRHLHGAADAQGPAAGVLHQARAREGDLRRRPRGLPRRQGQRDPRPGHGRALAAAPGRRRAQAGPQAADAGVQRSRAAHLPGHGHRRSPGTRSRTGRDGAAVPVPRPDERAHPRGDPPGRLRRHRREAAGRAAAAGQRDRQRQPGGPARSGAIPALHRVGPWAKAPSRTRSSSTS